MTASPKRSRVEAFLASYERRMPEVEKRIFERIYRAGLSPDDPYSLTLAHEAYQEASRTAFGESFSARARKVEEAVESLPALSRAVLADERHEQGAVIAARIAPEVRDALAASMPKLVRQFHWRIALHLITLIMIMVALASGAGYVMGRSETAGLQDRYASLATRPDAQSWLTLQAVNDNLDSTIARRCQPGQEDYIETAQGFHACAIPLWIDNVARPAPAGWRDQALDHLVSARATMPLHAIFLGIFLGMVLSGLLGMLRRRTAAQG